MNPEHPEVWLVAERLAEAVEAGVGLDFSDTPSRPTFLLPRRRGRVLVDQLLEDEATRIQVQAVLRVAVAFRRALLRGDPQAQARWLDVLGPRLAAAVREATRG